MSIRTENLHINTHCHEDQWTLSSFLLIIAFIDDIKNWANSKLYLVEIQLTII